MSQKHFSSLPASCPSCPLKNKQTKNINSKNFPLVSIRWSCESRFVLLEIVVASCHFFAGVPWAPAVVKQHSVSWNNFCHQILCFSTTFPNSSNANKSLLVVGSASGDGDSGVGSQRWPWCWNAEARGRQKIGVTEETFYLMQLFFF